MKDNILNYIYERKSLLELEHEEIVFPLRDSQEAVSLRDQIVLLEDLIREIKSL